MTLNPVAIFLGFVFWGWIWGIAGALLAVPMIAMFKSFCDHIEPLAPAGEFPGQRWRGQNRRVSSRRLVRTQRNQGILVGSSAVFSQKE